LDSDLTRLTIEDDFEPGQQRVKVVRITEFPPSIPLIIGDAVHNLRTAFDYIMVAITGMDWMALPVGRTPGRHNIEVHTLQNDKGDLPQPRDVHP